MSYCLNPGCPHPANPNDAEQCQQCGEILRLQNRYLALEPIGQGGFGRTFLAIDESRPLKPRCVIKQFFPQQQGTSNLEKASELFRQEAQRLEELGDHSQIPDLLAYLEQNGRQYLIQEFIDGQNLAQELEAGLFNETQIRQLLNDLLPVIQYMHQHQVIHRDIKPANIIRRTTDKKLFLVDLGAAKYTTGTALAITGTVIGSAEYTAPEQSRGKAVFASDLYSLGATCIHLLTGLSPFDLYDSGEGRWVWRDYAPCAIAPALGRILDKMLESATNQRYRSVDEILIDLHRLHLEPPSSHPTQDDSWDIDSPQFDAADSNLRFAEKPALANVSFETGGKLAAGEPGGTLRQPLPTDTPSELTPPELKRLGLIVVSTVLIFLVLPLFMLLGRSPRSDYPAIPVSRSLPNSPPSTIGLPPNADEPNPKLTNPVQPIQTLSATGRVLSLAISSDGKTLASGNDDSRASDISQSNPNFAIFKTGHDSNLQVWDLTTGKALHTITSRYPVWSVAISPDGKTLASQSVNVTNNPKTLDLAGLDNMPLRSTLQLWNLQPEKPLETLSESENTFGLSVVFSPDGKFLAGNANREQTNIWDVATRRKVQTLKTISGPVSFGSDNQTLFIVPVPAMGGSTSPQIERWDWRTGKQIDRLQISTSAGHGPEALGIPQLAVSQNSQMLIVGYRLGSNPLSTVIEIWTLQGSAATFLIAVNTKEMMTAIAISPDGSLFAIAGTRNSDEIVDVYDTRTQRLLRSLKGSSPSATSVVFSADGKKMITGNVDGTIKVWSVDQLLR